MRERKISVGKRTLVCGAGGGIETEEDDPKLWRRSSQSAEKMLSGDWSPESLKGASGKRLRRSVVAISDRSPILRRSEVKILFCPTFAQSRRKSAARGGPQCPPTTS